MLRRLSIILILAMNLVYFAPTLAASAQESQPGNTIAIMRKSQMGFNQWAIEDVRHIEDLVQKYPQAREKITALVFEEWLNITEEMRIITLRETIIMPETGVRIIPGNTTGKLHVLSLAQKARENFLNLAAQGAVSIGTSASIYPDLYIGSTLKVNAGTGSVKLSLASEDQYISPDEAIRAVNELAVPSGTLQGYSIYLMPYTMEGLDGFAFSQSIPRVEECSFISARDLDETEANVRTVIRHEIGHFIQHQYVGEYSSANGKWQEYLAINNKTYGEANWETDTTENFAEDFRVLFTKPGLDNSPHRGSCGNPANDQSTREKLIKYFNKIIAEERNSSVTFGTTFWAQGEKEASAVMPVNGIRDSEKLIIKGNDFIVRGTVKTIGAANPVILVQGNNYEKLIYLERTGFFETKITLPQHGQYQMILGEMRDNTLFAHYMAEVSSYSITYNLTEQELIDNKILTPVPQTALQDINDSPERWIINYLESQKLVLGWQNKFFPETNITRIELLAMLNRVVNEDSSNSKLQPFTDIPMDSWMNLIAVQALKNGIIDPNEYPDRLLHPLKEVTNQDAEQLINRIIKQQRGLMAEQDSKVLGLFSTLGEQNEPLKRWEAALIIYRLSHY